MIYLSYYTYRTIPPPSSPAVARLRYGRFSGTQSPVGFRLAAVRLVFRNPREVGPDPWSCKPLRGLSRSKRAMVPVFEPLTVKLCALSLWESFAHAPDLPSKHLAILGFDPKPAAIFGGLIFPDKGRSLDF